MQFSNEDEVMRISENFSGATGELELHSSGSSDDSERVSESMQSMVVVTTQISTHEEEAEV